MRLADRPSRAWQERDKLSQLLRSCSDIEQGMHIHERARRMEVHHTPLFASLLVSMYARCGDLDSAKSLFQSDPDIPAMNAMITAYGRSRDVAAAKEIFDEAPSRNPASWGVILAALAANGSIDFAREVFRRAPGRTLSMSTTMIAADCSILTSKEIFDEMPERDLIVWNAMVTAYARLGQLDQARKVLDKMPGHNVSSWAPLIHACASNNEFEDARQLYSRLEHGAPALCTEVARRAASWDLFQDLGNRNVISWTALLESSARLGNLDRAWRVFNAMPQRDAVAWRSMATAVARCGDPRAAKFVFESMAERDVAAWTTMIKAFGEDAGRAEEIYRKMPGHDAVAAAAMIMAFAHSGHLDRAKYLFSVIPEIDRGAWNTMIAASARFAADDSAELLRWMRCEGVDPDELSFVAEIIAHSHAGAVDDARELFRSIGPDHGMDPTQEHYWAMIDALARVGRIAEAEELVHSMPFLPDDVAWATLQRMECDEDSDIAAANRAVALNPMNGAAYVLLASSLRNPKF